jgi:hypothetical protein
MLCVISGLWLYFDFERTPRAASPQSSEIKAKPPIRYSSASVGETMTGRPIITHVTIADLDEDGLADILACDAQSDSVRWLRQSPRGTFTERVIGGSIAGPAHVTISDLNLDGQPDVLVAAMGVVLPNNDQIGSVIVLENLGDEQFRQRVLVDKIARVNDIRVADLNGDARLDLVVGQFGFDQGEIRWMENLGDWNFRSHILLSAPGTIMTPVADYNGDGLPDIAAVVSQEIEEIHLFTNLGRGAFANRILWKSNNPNWNSSGLHACDLDRDGDIDLLYTNGDGFTESHLAKADWHGLQWLENDGRGNFTYRRIGDLRGCYSPIDADLDGDGDIDVVTVSAFNDANHPDSVWLMAWLNDGRQRFTPVPLATQPIRLITVAAGDLDGTGQPVLVTGGFHVFPPFTDMSRLRLWRQAAK